jgi:hypothetical protein
MKRRQFINTLGWGAAALTLPRCRSRPVNSWKLPQELAREFVKADLEKLDKK